MATKRTTLPGTFADVLASGDLSRMIALFDTVDVNATAGRYGTNALGDRAVPPELMRWLVEHGADPNLRDTYGATPLSNQIIARNLDGVRTLLELGANADDVDSRHNSALKYAANNQRPEVVRLFLDAPAPRRRLSRKPAAPPADVLEAALAGCTNAGLPETVETVELLLAAGTKVSSYAREQVTRIGNGFEQMRDAFARDSLPQTDAALRRLYELTGVTPVAALRKHDGASPIELPPGPLHEQIDALWRLLVPGRGAASTEQGEAIRIVGRVDDELQRNGGVNWDAGHRAMLKNLERILASGDPLLAEELGEVRAAAKQLRNAADVSSLTDALNARVIEWIRRNPVPVPLVDVPYDR